MEFLLYSQLSTCSRRCMTRRVSKYGHPYEYIPRGNLLTRLAHDNNMTVDQVYARLMAERAEILRFQGDEI
jgi:hypothetical protein